MDLEMVLNELSLRKPAPDIPTARERMAELISTIRQATKFGVKKVIRTQSDINRIEIAPGYPVVKWRNDNAVDREVRRFFTTLISKAPFLEDISDSRLENIINVSEFKYEGESAIGLGIAYLLESLALSMMSDDCWDCCFLEVNFEQLDEDGEITEEKLQIIHGCRSFHIEKHEQEIARRIKTGIEHGIEIWERRGELFPNLEFCEVVRKQLENILVGQLELQPVIRTLFELQKCSKTWKSGAFSTQGYSIETSGESQETLNRYSQQRTFKCPDGQERLFVQHVKLRMCNWRIYFLPDRPDRRILIGYIGRHLQTVKYKT